MTSPHNRYRAAPAPMPTAGSSPSLYQTLGPLALKAGINAAIPGGGLAAEGASALGNAYLFNQGGRAPLGGGQTKQGLMEARKLGALTQAEFLKAMAHAGYMNKGGKVGCGPLAELSYKSEGGEVWTRKYHDPNKAQPTGGSASKEK